MERTNHLAEHRRVWERKGVLRLVYDDFYDRIAAACRPGLTLEIGGGIGNLKRRLADVISTDIQRAPWLDCVADAQRLPFADACAANIVLVDVLHHLEFPVVFFREAARVLRPGGRVLMVEPAITWGSSLFYRLLHHEPVRTSADVLGDGSPDPGRNPYDSNQAIPTLLATRERERFHRLFPALRIACVQWFAFAAYPLSGGFQSWSLIGEGGARRLLRIERALEPMLGRVAGFRLLLAVEKASEGRQVPVVSGLEDEPGHDGVGGARSTAVRTSAPRYETAPCKGGDRRADQAMRGLPSLLVSCR